MAPESATQSDDSDESEYTHGNATINAMLRDGTVRLSVNAEHNDSVKRMSPSEAYRLASNIRSLPVDLLQLGEPEAVADRLEIEAERVEQNAR